MESLEAFVSLCSDPHMVAICLLCVGVLIGFGLCFFCYLCDEIVRLTQAYRHAKIKK